MEIFNRESRTYKAIETVGGLVVLNLLFCVTCLGVVTIGASLSALYSAIYGDKSGKDYFSAFKENFWQSTAVWLCVLALAGISYLDISVVLSGGANLGIFALLCAAVAVAATLTLLCWAFPLIARFENSFGGVLKCSFVLGISKFPRTLAMIVLMFFLPYLFINNQYQFFAFASIILLLGFSLPAYLNTLLLEKVFGAFTEKETGIEE